MGRGSGPIGHAFEGEVGVGEDFSCFLLEDVEAFVFGAEVADNEPFDACQPGDIGGLRGSAMEPFAGLGFEIF